MDIQLEKIALIKKIADTEDVSIIAAIKDFFKTEKKDFWEELSMEHRFDIEESDKQIDRGEFVPYEAVMSKHR
jgi:hypothetical protein